MTIYAIIQYKQTVTVFNKSSSVHSGLSVLQKKLQQAIDEEYIRKHCALVVVHMTSADFQPSLVICQTSNIIIIYY